MNSKQWVNFHNDYFFEVFFQAFFIAATLSVTTPKHLFFPIESMTSLIS